MLTGESATKASDFVSTSFSSSLCWIQNEGPVFLVTQDDKGREGYRAPGTYGKADCLLSCLNPLWDRKAIRSLFHLNDFIITPGLRFILLSIRYFNYDFFSPWAVKPLGFCLLVQLFQELIKCLSHVFIIRKWKQLSSCAMGETSWWITVVK